MRSAFLIGLFCCAALAVGGCFETTQVLTLNPDGSGKMLLDSYMKAPPMMMGGDEKPDPKKIAKNIAQSMVSGANGVEAWSDLSYEVAKDGRTHIQGTAYFKDYTKLDMKQGGGMDFTWAKDPKGGMALEVKMADRDQAEPAAKPKLTDKELQDLIQAKRQEYQQMKPMMTMILGTMKMDMTFMLPGKLSEVNVFDKTDKGGVRLVFVGKKMLEVMDKIMADDKLLADAIEAWRDPIKGGPESDKIVEL
ncbi:MAG TPA: hypothetical protein VMZ50_10625, partial [Phycisphaerae bacterium]|nr:hypothetical protein [Phycisphaerae bacterium]